MENNANQMSASVGMRKSEKINLILIFLLYAVFFVMGVVGMVAPKSGILWSTNDMSEYHIEAMNFLTGLAMVAMSAAAGLVVAFRIMIKKGKKKFIITLAISLILMVVLDVVYFIVKGQADGGKYDAFLDLTSHANGNISDSLSIVLALLLSQVGTLILYFSKFVRINAESLTKGFIKSILRFKLQHENLFNFICTFMLTFGVFISVYILVVVIFLLILAIMIVIIRKFGVDTPRYSYVICDGGYDRTLEYDGYYMGMDRFKDDTGTIWYSDDGCKTFFKG